jgi:Na+/melibiose symporter-like transporter
MLYFLSVTAASLAVNWLVSLIDDRASLALCFGTAVAAGALAWLSLTWSYALDRRREQRRAKNAEARQQLTERLTSAFST